jgi:hypothetical protein
MSLSPVAWNTRTYGRRRKDDRVRLTLSARIFFPDHNLEDVCKLVDLSPSGACLKSTVSAPVGSRIVLYADGFGRYEASVVWRDESTLRLEFHCTEARRARTAEQLAAFHAKR